jgi:hypothetical protein
VPDTAPSPVAALAHALPATCWDRRTVAEGTKGPIPYECARQRLRLCTEGPPTTAGGGSSSGRWAPSRGTGTIAATPRCGPRYAGAGGAVACGGRSHSALRKQKRRGGWTTMQAARSRAGIIIGARGCWPTSGAGSSSSGWKKKPQHLRARQSTGYWQWGGPSKSARRLRSYSPWRACNSVSTGPLSRTEKDIFMGHLIK